MGFRRQLGICRRRVFAIALATLLSIGSASLAAEAWRPLVPEDWLAVAATPDWQATEAKLTKLLAKFSYNYAGASAALLQLAGVDQLGVADGEVVVGVAGSPNGQAAGLVPFALLPVDDFTTLVESLGGEVTGDVGVATLLGFDVCLAPGGGWALAMPLEQLELAQTIVERSRHPPRDADIPAADLTVELSPAGLDFAIARADAVDWRSRKRILNRGLNWPPSLTLIDAAIAQNGPLLARWRERFDGLKVGFTIGDEDRLVAEVVGPLREPIASLPTGAAKGVDLPAPSPMARLTGRGDGPTSDLLVDLYLAYARGRPDEVDSPGYPLEPYQHFVAATRAAMQHVKHFSLIARTQPTDQSPLLANQAILLKLDDRSAFEAAAAEAILRWNAVVAGADAQMQIAFDTKRYEHRGRPLLEFSVDMIDAINVGVSPEIRTLMQRLFGEDSRYAWRLLPIGESHALFADLPLEDAIELCDQLEGVDAAVAEEQAPTIDRWQAEVYLDRFLAWQSQVLEVTQGRVLGGRRSRTMASSPPLQIDATADASQLKVQATLQPQTLQAMAGYLSGDASDR
ncbi:MAG: hypothetical protein AAGF31_05035 [Planctomycetota bacterium]